VDVGTVKLKGLGSELLCIPNRKLGVLGVSDPRSGVEVPDMAIEEDTEKRIL
jgi:hypothetical protein